ncbi:MAG: ADOP family duplicated permease [Gemmatimonadales bacterium]
MADVMRQTLRSLRRAPLFSVTTILTLGLGIALVTAAFSLVDAVLLSPLPFADAGRIVTLIQTGGTNGAPASYPNLRDWRAMDSTGSFIDLAYARGRATTLHLAQGDHTLFVTLVSEGFFNVLRPHLVRGRYFTPAEERSGAHVAIITDNVWREQFRADSGILGRSISLSDGDFTVVGVVPGYPRVYPDWGQIYLPLAPFLGTETVLSARDFHADSRTIGRLKPGATLARARAELGAIAGRLARAYPAEDGPWPTIAVAPLSQELLGTAPSNLRLLGVAMGLVLLIGWVNVTNLSLVRSSGRIRELAIRSSLGASRGRLVARLIGEHLVLAFAAAIIGGLAASWAIGLMRGFAAGAPGISDAAVNLRAWIFAAGIAIVSAAVVAALPAIRIARADLAGPIKDGTGGAGSSGRQQRIRAVLVAAELAIALTLVISAGLLVKSFWRLRHVDPGFSTRGLVALDFSPPAGKYAAPAAAGAFYGRILAAVQAVPGVDRAALTNHMPLVGASLPVSVDVAGRASDPRRDPRVLFRTLSPEYISTLRIPVKAGRNFTAADLTSGNAVLVNETFVKDYLPGSDPLGRAVMLHKAAQGFPDLGEPLPSVIAGVIGDVHHYGVSVPPVPEIYVPYTRNPWSHMVVVAHAKSGDGRALIPALRRAVLGVDSAVNVNGGIFQGFGFVDDMLKESYSGSRFDMLLLGGFAACALLLAAIGVYGLMAYGIAQRTREIGIRMALGADRSVVLRMVLGAGGRLIAGGVAAGLAGAFAVTRVVSSLLFGVKPFDPATFAVMTVVLVAAALAACYLPARRASRIEPGAVLRDIT